MPEQGVRLSELQLLPIHVLTTLFGITTVWWVGDIFREATGRLGILSILLSGLIALAVGLIVALHVARTIESENNSMRRPTNIIRFHESLFLHIVELGIVIVATPIVAAWFAFRTPDLPWPLEFWQAVIVGGFSISWLSFVQWLDRRVALMRAFEMTADDAYPAGGDE